MYLCPFWGSLPELKLSKEIWQNLFPKSDLQYDHHSHFTHLSKNKHSTMTSLADFFAVISELTNE